MKCLHLLGLTTCSLLVAPEPCRAAAESRQPDRHCWNQMQTIKTSTNLASEYTDSGLSRTSPLVKFQKYLYDNVPGARCPKPCSGGSYGILPYIFFASWVWEMLSLLGSFRLGSFCSQLCIVSFAISVHVG